MDSEDECLYGSDSGHESSNDDDDFPMPMEEAEPGVSAQDKIDYVDDFHYEVLTPEKIVQHMVDCIKEVNQVVEIPATTTRILLNHFKWDKEKLMERYYDSDQEAVFAEAHVISPYRKPCQTKSGKRARTSPDSKNEELICEICLCNMHPSEIIKPATRSSEEISPAMMTGLECGHRFCSTCWCGYLTTKIMEEGMGQTIECAAHACDILVDDATVMRLVTDSKVRLKYQHLITNSFVECNRLMRWCPAPECNNVIKASYPDARPVTCTCTHTFCFACGNSWHDPVKCRLLKKWQKKCDDDSETSNWIAANTKECPKCNVTIEKDGGCNHMVCKNQSCKADFCWVCLGPWEPHGSSWYNCNRYDEDDAKAARDAQEVSR
ncbi:PREDICTED: E3 ubiquitin-protein ligase arih1l-like, partial [Priapulus caudatus]|uniref:RBR-type E3 ubiquitin transferase n=1 Tax=Priapulus caudatus TaxID=37621 RepID=A0ABM1E6W9_PRICU